MPTRKIRDLEPPHCRHPEHNPPNMRVFEPGVYEHECPACGKTQTFVVRGVSLSADDGTNPMHAFGHGRGD